MIPHSAPPPSRPPAAAPSEQRLLRRYARLRDPRDLEALVTRYRPLAMRLARRYATGALPREDLQQVACLGLVKALQRFDPDRGLRFSSFAVPTIAGELRHFCRDTTWVAHVPRAMQERAAKVRATSDQLEPRLGRAPTTQDLADELGWAREEVVDALVAVASRATVPLERIASDDEDDTPSVADRLGVTERGYEVVEEVATLDRALPALTDAELTVLRLHFADGLKQREIAERLGSAEGQVARTLESGLSALRRILGPSRHACGEARPHHALAA